MPPKKSSKARSKQATDPVDTVDWLELPDDLWVEIASRLPKRDLLALSGVCKYFRRLTTRGCRGLWGPVSLLIDFNKALHMHNFRQVTLMDEEEENDGEEISIREKGGGLVFDFPFDRRAGRLEKLDTLVRWASNKLLGGAIDRLSIRITLGNSYHPLRTYVPVKKLNRADARFIGLTIPRECQNFVDDMFTDNEYDSDDLDGLYDAAPIFEWYVEPLEQDIVNGLLPLLDAANEADPAPDLRYQIHGFFLNEINNAVDFLETAVAHCPAADFRLKVETTADSEGFDRAVDDLEIAIFIDDILKLPRSVTLTLGSLHCIPSETLELLTPVVPTFQSLALCFENSDEAEDSKSGGAQYDKVTFSTEPPALTRLRLILDYRPDYQDPFLRALADASQLDNVTSLRIDVCRLFCSMRPSELEKLGRLLSSLPKLTSLTMSAYVTNEFSESELFQAREEELSDGLLEGSSWLHFKRSGPGAPLALLPDSTRDRDPAHPLLPEGPLAILLTLLPPSVTSARILTPEVNPFEILSLDWTFLQPRAESEDDDEYFDRDGDLVDRLELLQRFSQCGMRLDVRHPDTGETLLFSLCDCDVRSDDQAVMADAVRFLQENGNSLLSIDNKGKSVLHKAVDTSQEWVPVLLDACASDDERHRFATLRPPRGNTALVEKLWRGSRPLLWPTTMRHLLRAGTLSSFEMDADTIMDRPGRPLLLDLIGLCSSYSGEGLVELLEELLSQFGHRRAARIVDSDGFTLLMELLRNNNIANGPGLLEAVKFLIDRGVDVHARSKHDDRTALYFAAHRGSFEVCKTLIEAGVDASVKDQWGSTALDAARGSLRKEQVLNSMDDSRRKALRAIIKLLVARTKADGTKGKGQDGAGAEGKGKGKGPKGRGQGVQAKKGPPAGVKEGAGRGRKGKK